MKPTASVETIIWFDGDDSGKKYKIEYFDNWIKVYDGDVVKVQFWAEDLKIFMEMLYGKIVK